MVRTATPAIPAKIYRHFAVITLVLTGALALFADGENREAVAEVVAEQQQSTKVRRESQAQFFAPAEETPLPDGAFGSDSDGGTFGAPMDNPSGGRSSSIQPAQADTGPAEAAGYSQEYLDSLSPAERELLLKGLESNGLLSEDALASRAAALTAASARRSGIATAAE